MNSEALQAFMRVAESALLPIAHRSGKILYSSARTLRRGSLYILGFNPGGDPDRQKRSHYTISEALRRLLEKSDNDYIDEVWQHARIPGGSPLQRRMRLLCEQIGQPIEEVCAANLVFVRSRHAAGVGYPETAHIYWPVHQAILAIVQPRLILTHGSQVYDYILRKSSRSRSSGETIASGHGTWVCRQTRIELAGRFIYLVQLPHLSRYNPKRNLKLIDWLAATVSAG